MLSRDTTTTVTITGVNFTVQQGSVLLAMPGENDITTVTISSWTPSQIICKIRISASKELGKWDLVVFKGFDNTKIVKADAIAITEEMSLTAITPTSGQVDDDDVDFTLTGESFDEDTIDSVYLYNPDYDNITADDVDVASSTKITGTFDLDGADEDTYDVCIEDIYGNVFCDLSFEITTNEVGSIDVSSNPSGAQIYIDGMLNGTTPDTIDDVIVGSHRITLRKSGYQE